MEKRKILKYTILGGCIIIAAIFLIGIAGQFQPAQAPERKSLTLKNYPELFSQNVMIVVGEKATEVEKEAAEMIKENLKGLTGNEPIIKKDTKFLELDKKTTYNLILIGTPTTNHILQKVYKLTDATKVTSKYPGENKGILEILRSPWNPNGALLIIAGSDSWGSEMGAMKLIVDHNKLEEKVKVVKSINKTDIEGWIVEGSKSSFMKVKLNKEIVKLKEDFGLWVTATTFAPDVTVKGYEYFRCYIKNNPVPLHEKKVYVSKKKNEMYARITPFYWEIETPQKPGVYTYRVVRKVNSWPQYDNYDSKVEFEVIVESSYDKAIKSNFLSISSDLTQPTETAKLALNKRYGENWFKKYQIGKHFKYPSIPFDHWFVRINSDFSILITYDKVYFLSPREFNEFLDLYGEKISLEEDKDVVHLFEIYLSLYGLSSAVQDEEIFTKRHLKLWTAEIKEKYNVDPEEFAHIEIKRENSYYLLDCYTITRVSSYPRVPSPQDIIISHYSVKLGNKGQVYLNLIDKTKYEEAIPAGPR